MIKSLFKKEKIKQNGVFEFEEKFEHGCDHKKCTCITVIKGVHPLLEDQRWVLRQTHFYNDIREFCVDFSSNFDQGWDGALLRRQSDRDLLYFMSGLKEINIRTVRPPLPKLSYPMSSEKFYLPAEVKQVYKWADLNTFAKVIGSMRNISNDWMEENVWSEKVNDPNAESKLGVCYSPVLPLKALAMRYLSNYQWHLARRMVT